jgi:predicted ATP-dependent serine protease
VPPLSTLGQRYGGGVIVARDKGSSMAGQSLEHIVDTVLYLKSIRFTPTSARSVKNRFGATS